MKKMKLLSTLLALLAVTSVQSAEQELCCMDNLDMVDGVLLMSATRPIGNIDAASMLELYALQAEDESRLSEIEATTALALLSQTATYPILPPTPVSPEDAVSLLEFSYLASDPSNLLQLAQATEFSAYANATEPLMVGELFSFDILDSSFFNRLTPTQQHNFLDWVSDKENRQPIE